MPVWLKCLLKGIILKDLPHGASLLPAVDSSQSFSHGQAKAKSYPQKDHQKRKFLLSRIALTSKSICKNISILTVAFFVIIF